MKNNVTIKKVSIHIYGNAEEGRGGSEEREDIRKINEDIVLNKLPKDLREAIKKAGFEGKVVAAGDISDLLGGDSKVLFEAMRKQLGFIHKVVHSIKEVRDALAIIAHTVCAETGTMKDLVEATKQGDAESLLTEEALNLVCDEFEIEKPVIDFAARQEAAGTWKEDREETDTALSDPLKIV